MDIDLVELMKDIEETEKIDKHRDEFERWVNERYISNTENVE